jgi:hypothetical protein
VPLKRCIPLMILCLTGVAHPVRADDIEAIAATNMAPAQCGGGCTQITVRDMTNQFHTLKLRRPGSNWELFNFTPGMALRFRCYVCVGALDARLPEDDADIQIAPGSEYVITYLDGRQHPYLLPSRR